jgi:hypothetical protein
MYQLFLLLLTVKWGFSQFLYLTPISASFSQFLSPPAHQTPLFAGLFLPLLVPLSWISAQTDSDPLLPPCQPVPAYRILSDEALLLSDGQMS